jgi:dTMP kinase
MGEPGKLIVLEGIDGAGTTTQAQRLCGELVRRGLQAHGTAQPSRGPVGRLIREVLGGQLMSTDAGPPDFATMSLLFAADRQDQQTREIAPLLSQGVHVVCDRWVHSSVIYQSVSAGDTAVQEWIRVLNRYMRTPDLVVYLQIDAETAAARRAARGGKEEMFDRLAFQKQLIVQYDRMGDIFQDERICTLDARLTVDELAARVAREVFALLNMEEP